MKMEEKMGAQVCDDPEMERGHNMGVCLYGL